MFPVIDLGPFAIQAPGLILILSFLLGTWLIGRLAKALGTNGDVIENSLLVGLVAGILSARIGFFLQNPAIFTANPLSLFSLTPTMLNPSFGLLAGVLGAYITAQRNHLPLWPTLDTLTPMVVTIFIGLHLANLANGNAYGLPTNLPWGFQLWGILRHPVQIYAIILAFGLTAWLLFRTKGLTETGYMRSGVLVLTTLAALAATTIFTRTFVAEKRLLWRIDILQLGAFTLLAFALGAIYRRTIQITQSYHALIGLGSNQKPRENLQRGINHLSEAFDVLRTSSLYQSSDVRGQNKSGTFLNSIVEIKTDFSYPALWKRLKSIEHDLGRERGNKDVVPLDLDILTCGREVFVFSGRKIPDPNLIQYRYIAEPLAELAPDFRHPADGRSIMDILKKMTDQSQVEKIGKVENGIKG